MVDAATMIGIGLTVLGVGGPITAAIFKYGPSSPNGSSTRAQGQEPSGGNGKVKYMTRDLCEERSGNIRSDIEEMKDTQQRMWVVLNKVHENSQETMKMLLAQKKKEGNGHGG